jgi:glucose-6-phosphate-specific signal transduction histidine kinase
LGMKMPPMQLGERLIWGFVGAMVGSLVGVVLTIMMLFAAPPLHVSVPSPHAVALLVVIGSPILIGALLGLALPRQAHLAASDVARGLESAYRQNARRRH